MSKKRIVLSDEEDDRQEDTAMDLGETASAQKLTESIHHMKVSDSASKPPRYQSVRKKLFDEDEDERDKSKSNASRNGSRRTQVLSGKKEVQRAKAAAEIQRFLPSAETRKAFSEYRGGRESDDEPYASDMDDFIVADDVSVDDAAQEAAASESDDAEMDGVEARNGEDDDSVGGRAVRKTLVHTKSPPVKPSKSKSTSQRKTVVLLSDEEGADQEEEETPHVSKSTKKRRLNAQMDEAADGGNDSDDLDVAGQLFSMNHKYTLEEAFAKYLELLGKVLISPSFRRQIQERSLSRHQMVAYDKACRQIENLVCTHRESLLGSSAWQGDFLQELQHRPFYMCPQSTVAGAAAAGCCGDDHRCAACGRAAKEAFFNVYLHGPSYDGMAIWSQKWVQSLPTCVFLHRDDEEDAEDADDFDAADRADRNRRLSGNKRNRSHRYLSYEEAAEAAEQDETAGRRARGHDSSLNSRRPTPAKLSSSGDAAGDVIDMTDASDQPSTATAKWWNKALPRALNQESETRWELSIHCKNRTNLYHTLLHYKFRLMLKIREQLERLHQRQSEGAYAGLTLEELPPAYVSSLLRDLLDPQRRHRSLVVQETDRLQVLLRTAEKRYGGDKYETQVDIWGTETLPINSSRGKSSSSSGGSSSSSSSFAASAAPVFSAKTTRPLKLIKKDFRTTSTGGSSSSSGAGGISVMGEPRRAAFQARISSWLTPKN
eukprot:gene2987-2189_t